MKLPGSNETQPDVLDPPAPGGPELSSCCCDALALSLLATPRELPFLPLSSSVVVPPTAVSPFTAVVPNDLPENDDEAEFIAAPPGNCCSLCKSNVCISSFAGEAVREDARELGAELRLSTPLPLPLLLFFFGGAGGTGTFLDCIHLISIMESISAGFVPGGGKGTYPFCCLVESCPAGPAAVLGPLPRLGTL